MYDILCYISIAKRRLLEKGERRSSGNEQEIDPREENKRWPIRGVIKHLLQ